MAKILEIGHEMANLATLDSGQTEVTASNHAVFVSQRASRSECFFML